MVNRVPVDFRLFAVNEARIKKIKKHPLLVFVIGGVTGRNLARPVQRQAHRLQLSAHGGDVCPGPCRRMRVVLHRGILGGHAKGVPAHRMQHIEAARPLVARHNVAHRIVAHMAHMYPPGRIREHFKHVIFLARIVIRGLECLPCGPDRLPARFSVAGVVTFPVAVLLGQNAFLSRLVLCAEILPPPKALFAFAGQSFCRIGGSSTTGDTGNLTHER